MERLRVAYKYIRKKYDLLSLKKYTTIAGTLVFFLIMSIVPLSFWLTLVLGKFSVDAEDILALPAFEAVKDIFLFVRQEAAEATAGASIILVFTTLYSSTTLFYQMRKSGEIIYEFHNKRHSWKLRIGALLLMLIVMVAVAAFLIVFGLGSFLFSRLLSKTWERIADYALLIAMSFFLVLLLNMYVCPYKAKAKTFIPGTVVTVIAWVGAVIGFSFYLKISNMRRLYGALSAIIVFLLWLYLLMIGFIIGVIFNSENVRLSRKKNKRKRKSAY